MSQLDTAVRTYGSFEEYLEKRNELPRGWIQVEESVHICKVPRAALNGGGIGDFMNKKLDLFMTLVNQEYEEGHVLIDRSPAKPFHIFGVELWQFEVMIRPCIIKTDLSD